MSELASMKSMRSALLHRSSPSTKWLTSNTLAVDTSEISRTALLRDLLRAPVDEIAMSGTEVERQLLRTTRMARHPLWLAWVSRTSKPFIDSRDYSGPIARFVDASGPRADVSAEQLRLVWDLLGGGWDRVTSEGHGKPLAFWRLGRPMAFIGILRTGLPPVPAGHPISGHDPPRAPPSPSFQKRTDPLPLPPAHPKDTPRATRHTKDLTLLASTLGGIQDRFSGYDWCLPTRGGVLRVGVSRDGHLRGRFDDPPRMYAIPRHPPEYRLITGPLDLYAGLYRGGLHLFLREFKERDEVGLLSSSLYNLGLLLAPGIIPPVPLEDPPPAFFGPHFEVEPEEDSTGRAAWRLWDVAKAHPMNGLSSVFEKAEEAAERLSFAACLALDARRRIDAVGAASG